MNKLFLSIEAVMIEVHDIFLINHILGVKCVF